MRKILILISLVLFSALSFGQGAMMGSVGASGGASYLDVLEDGNTVGWYIAHSDYITEDVGVTTWEDASDAGNDLIQTTDLDEPVFAGDSVTFDGTNHYLKTATFTWDQPATIYIVLTQLSFTSGDMITHGDLFLSVYLTQSGTSPSLRSYAGTVSLGNNNLPINQLGIIRQTFNGASSKFQIDETTALTGDFGSTDPDGFTLGAYHNGSGAAHFSVREIILRNVDDSDTDEALVYDYLKDKYGL